MLKKIQSKTFLITEKYGKLLGLDLTYFVKNGFWVALRQGMGMAGGIMLSIAFARFASQEVFGQYQFILSVLSIASILSIPGLNTSITQSVARGHDGDYKQVVKVSFVWSLLGVPALLIVGGYYYVFQNHILGIAFLIASLFFPFFYAPNTWDAFLQGKGRFDVSAKYASVQTILNTLATMAVIFFSHSNLILIIIIYLFSYSFFNGYYYFKSLKYIKNRKKDEDVIRYGWFLTFTGVTNLISSNLDKIILGFISLNTLAIYGIAVKLFDNIKNFYKIFTGIYLPKFSANDTSVKSRNIFFVFVLTIFLTLILFIFANKIVVYIFGKDYEEAGNLFKILTLLVPIIFINYILGIEILAKKTKKSIFLINTIPNIAQILYLVFLIIFFGKNITPIMLIFSIFVFQMSNFLLFVIKKINFEIKK